MRGYMRRRECAYARARAEPVGGTGEQNGNERRRTERKRGANTLKEGVDGETREEWKESPQVFDLGQQN